MDQAETLAEFGKVTAELRARHEQGEYVRGNMSIAVRHFTHPSSPELAKVFMQRAAKALGEEVDAQGWWEPCRGDVAIEEAMRSTPQVEVPP